jgi:signal transduction histidine kinase
MRHPFGRVEPVAMDILSGLKIKAKLALVLAISAMSLIATIALGASFVHNQIVAGREEKTRELAEVARGIVRSWYEQEQSGALTRSQAQAAAVAALRPLRYGKNDYYFIQRYDGVAILNPNLPEVEGQNRWDSVDPEGVPRVREQIETAQRGGGFVYYRIQRAGATEPIPKLSFIAGFNDWQWAIGTGVYIDDIQVEFRSTLLRLGAIASAIFAAAMLCAFFINRNVGGSLRELKIKMERLAAGDLSVDMPEAERRDEIGDMAKAMRVFKENARAAQRLRAETEKRRELETQAALNHAQRVDALGRLAGGIAHDLNNSLVPVLALTKSLASRTPKDSREHRNLELILMGAQRGKDLVQQILAFSRKQDIEKRDFELAPVIADGIKMLRAIVPSTIKVESTIDPVPVFHGDSGQLHQVLVNLVTNAAQAIGEAPGTIAILLRQESDSQLRFTVSDTGAGMDEQTKDHIFEPFFTTKDVGKGTGLGLSVVHGIVAAHGGTIVVHSVPGAGTRVDVLLPVAPAGQPATAAEQPAWA